jgi:hypothetical protein
MKKLLLSLAIASSSYAIVIETPCILVHDFANHRTYLKVDGHELDIIEWEHSYQCPCYYNILDTEPPLD